MTYHIQPASFREGRTTFSHFFLSALQFLTLDFLEGERNLDQEFDCLQRPHVQQGRGVTNISCPVKSQDIV